MSLLVLGEIFGLSVDTFTSDGKYPLEGCENLQLGIQMQLSEKRKKFFTFFVSLLDSTSNFEHFQRKHDGHS